MPSIAMQEQIEQLTQAILPPDAGFAERRAAYDSLSTLFPAVSSVRQEIIDLGGVKTIRYLPPNADLDRAVLYFHGGGYCIGSELSHAMIVTQLAISAGCPVLFPLYRLAPEDRFPAAPEDCYRAWRAVIESGLNPAKTGFAGDSAGGALAVIVMQMARDNGTHLPACGVAISPWVDMEGTESWRSGDPLRDAFLHPAELALFVETFINESDWRNPLAAPLHGQFHDLPPFLIQTSASELLYRDAMRLVDSLTEAGVEITLQVAESGTPHVWHHMTPLVPESLKSLEQAGKFLAEQTENKK